MTFTPWVMSSVTFLKFWSSTQEFFVSGKIKIFANHTYCTNTVEKGFNGPDS